MSKIKWKMTMILIIYFKFSDLLEVLLFFSQFFFWMWCITLYTDAAEQPSHSDFFLTVF